MKRTTRNKNRKRCYNCEKFLKEFKEATADNAVEWLSHFSLRFWKDYCKESNNGKN